MQTEQALLYTLKDDGLGELIDSQQLAAQFRRLAADRSTGHGTAVSLRDFADEIEANARRVDREQTRPFDGATSLSRAVIPPVQ